MRAVAQRRHRVAGYVPGDNARRLFEALARADPLLHTRLGIAHVEWTVLALLTLHSHILIVVDFPPARQGFTPDRISHHLGRVDNSVPHHGEKCGLGGPFRLGGNFFPRIALSSVVLWH